VPAVFYTCTDRAGHCPDATDSADWLRTGAPGERYAASEKTVVSWFFVCAPGRNRTCDLGIRRPLLYPTELRRHAIDECIRAVSPRRIYPIWSA
jgi:hypothetical protein